MLMNQPDKKARKALNDINADAATVFVIPGTGKRLRMRYIKPYTIERLTRVWSEVEQAAPAEDAPQALRYACGHAYLPYEEAALYSLNSYWKIRLFLRLRTWIWSMRYSVEQMNAVIAEGKKKLLPTLRWYYENMALTMDTREDWMRMTAKEAGQYRAELISAAERLSSRNTPSTAG